MKYFVVNKIFLVFGFNVNSVFQTKDEDGEKVIERRAKKKKQSKMKKAMILAKQEKEKESDITGSKGQQDEQANQLLVRLWDGF